MFDGRKHEENKRNKKERKKDWEKGNKRVKEGRKLLHRSSFPFLIHWKGVHFKWKKAEREREREKTEEVKESQKEEWKREPFILNEGWKFLFNERGEMK